MGKSLSFLYLSVNRQRQTTSDPINDIFEDNSENSGSKHLEITKGLLAKKRNLTKVEESINLVKYKENTY